MPASGLLPQWPGSWPYFFTDCGSLKKITYRSTNLLLHRTLKRSELP
jgi:hypothetical protein